jgi:hypothetical protein
MSIRLLPVPEDPSDAPSSEPLMWHVTLTASGDPVTAEAIKTALERLSEEHPFLLAGRFAIDRAEVRYWEQADDAESAVSLALHLWDEHVDSAGLPPWTVVGVEVVDRETFHRRGRWVSERPGLVAAGRVIPF